MSNDESLGWGARLPSDRSYRFYWFSHAWRYHGRKEYYCADLTYGKAYRVYANLKSVQHSVYVPAYFSGPEEMFHARQYQEIFPKWMQMDVGL
jgi:hypothetical protein